MRSCHNAQLHGEWCVPCVLVRAREYEGVHPKHGDKSDVTSVAGNVVHQARTGDARADHLFGELLQYRTMKGA